MIQDMEVLKMSTSFENLFSKFNIKDIEISEYQDIIKYSIV